MPRRRPEVRPLACPRCRHEGSVVVADTRIWRGMVRRRRDCTACQYRYWTVEVPDVLVSGLPGIISSLKQTQADMQRSVNALEATRAWTERQETT